MTTSPIPELSIQPAPRSAHWTCFLVAAAVLTACGGGDDSAQVPRAMAKAQSLTVEEAPGPGAASCDSQINDTTEKLLACVTLTGVRAHQSKLEEIAKANNGTRMAGTPGYKASVAYARKVFEDAGYRVSVQSFKFPAFQALHSSLLEVGQPAAEPVKHYVAAYSGSGDVSAPVSVLPDPMGCKTSDFVGFPPGNIALIRRGECALTDKVVNALAAGATGVVIYNHDEGELTGGLSVDAPQDIPVAMVSQAEGERLAQRAGVHLHLKTETSRYLRTAYNVLAESVDGDTDHIAMVGAHLDSVRAGSGSNDNGSGVAAVLETARQMARVKPVNQLRFALWGAEEQGLLGSRHYTKNLKAAEKASIGIYLNFDMIGSPNHIFYVYGDDGSGISDTNPQAPSKIADIFGDFYKQRGIPFSLPKSRVRSDQKSFTDIGIPAGGVFSGAEEIKTQQEAEIWGGKAGVALDPCYHRACDNLANYGAVALEVNAGAVAYSTLFFAMNKVPQPDSSR